MRTILAVIMMMAGVVALGQGNQLSGEILDEQAQPLPSATAVLLDPADSTLQYFAIAGNDGRFVMKNIKNGEYLLQVSLVGYKTLYRKMTIPVPGAEEPSTIILTSRTYDLGEVTVTGERIPMRIKEDTIEYDAKAFRVNPDAVAEDLIKKLPGIEVDRAGNIKAMGEDVKNVLVDGKEFFGSDPKVATRNLPADAIEKVQLFDRQSDESAFTGVDDGQRDPTLNFVLDEKKKSGIFGELSAGAGTAGHGEASAKAYRFTKKTQLAALAMYNNINQYGFSLRDYINFSGGISALTSGDGRIVLGGESTFPVNFGQPVYGHGSNGAAGLNFSVFDTDRNRLFVSYLGSGAKRVLHETSTTKNYLPDATYTLNETLSQVKRDTSHRVNFGLRKKIGERHIVILNGGLNFNSGSNPLTSISESILDNDVINRLDRTSDEVRDGVSVNTDGSYIFKINEGKTIFRLSGKAAFSGSGSNARFFNQTQFFNPSYEETKNQFYDLGTETGNYSGSISLTQRVSGASFMDISFNAGIRYEDMRRRQGDISDAMTPDDLLSPDFSKKDRFIKPVVTWKRATKKSNITFALGAEAGEFTSVLNNDDPHTTPYFYLIPRARWEYDYRSGRRLMLDYSSQVNTPQAVQLLPVVNNLNALSLFYGNRDLRAEYSHTLRANWWLFDQFSFTTLMTGASIRYVSDKIGYVRDVSASLEQTVTLANMRDDINISGDIDFTTPVKPLGIKINIALNEEYDRSVSIINGVENLNNNMAHRISLTVDNRKKDKWDIETGTALTLSSSRYSVRKSLNNSYNDLSWFGEVRYTPGSHFSMMMSADITGYSSKSFDVSQVIPLLGTEISCYFLKNNRATVTLAAIDLLDRNTGIERMSELNYLVERRSEIIGRYIMLSFRYKLNKTGENGGGLDVQVRRR